MKTYAEFIEETRQAAEAALDVDLSDRCRFIGAAEKHELPPGLEVIEPARSKIRIGIANGPYFPTQLTCDRCSFQLVWSKEMTRPRREVCCPACGWCGFVPWDALIGADWPAAPAEGMSK